MTLTDRLSGTSTAGADAAFDVFIDWAGERGFALYAAQEEAVLALAGGAHVVLATPTGSGKSLVAVAAHALALAEGRRSWYTAPRSTSDSPTATSFALSVASRILSAFCTSCSARA